MTKSGKARWNIKWTDQNTFKVDQEGDKLTDECITEWGSWLDSQIQERFGSTVPRLTAAGLNFSRCGLDDDAVRQLLEYLYSRDIAVQTLKLFRNSISDGGATAVGQFLAHATTPSHEIHLSHNLVTERGICSLLESVAWSGRYPFPVESGCRDKQDNAPVWLRVEHNCIDWSVIDHRLSLRSLRWCSAESRDGWATKDQAPAVCFHSSYKHQLPEKGSVAWNDTAADEVPPAGASGDGSLLLAALRPAVTPGQGPAEEAAPAELMDEVPLYTFLDAGTVRQMLTREDGLLRFNGLINLCAQGHMKCAPADGGPLPPWLEAVEEHECIMFAITDVVMDELEEQSGGDPVLLNELNKFKAQDQTSLLSQCMEWGILEILDTSLHTQVIKLSEHHQKRAQELSVPSKLVRMLDFVCLWQSQIEADGRVLFVTEDLRLQSLGKEVAASGNKGQWPRVLLLGELCQLFLQDAEMGGSKLSQVSLERACDSGFCGVVLSASLFSRVASSQRPGSLVDESLVGVRQEIHEAVAVLAKALRLTRAGNSDSANHAAEVKKIESAVSRWRTLLGTLY